MSSSDAVRSSHEKKARRTSSHPGARTTTNASVPNTRAQLAAAIRFDRRR